MSKRKDNIFIRIADLIIIITAHLIPQVSVWKRAYFNFRKSSEQMEDLLNNGLQRRLTKKMLWDWHQVNNDYTYWKFTLFTEECKIVFWIGLTLSLFLGGLSCVAIIIDLFVLLLVLLYRLNPDIHQ